MTDVSEGSQRSTIHTACHIVFIPLKEEFHVLITLMLILIVTFEFLVTYIVW